MQAPYPVEGVVTAADGNLAEGATVVLLNTDLEETISMSTNAQGEYLLDLSELPEDYANNQFCYMIVRYSSPKQYATYTFTVDTAAGGVNVEYTIKPEKGKWLNITALQISFADEYDGTLADGTMIKLSYDKLLGLELTNGWNYQRIESEEVVSSVITKSIHDMLQYPNTHISSSLDDGTNVFISLSQEFLVPVLLKSENEDKLRILIRDNMTGLEHFRITYQGYTEDR